MNKKVGKNVRAMEHLMPNQGEKTQETTHHAHQVWIAKIQRVWEKLNMARNSEVVRIQNEIRRNKSLINDLMRENLFELDINSHEQKLLLGAQSHYFKINQKLKNSSVERRVQKLQSRVREEIAR